MRALNRSFVVFVFFLSSTGLMIPLLRQKAGSVSTVSGGDPVTQILWLGVYAVTFCLIASQWRRFVSVVMRDKLLLLLIVVAVLSVVWSFAPEVTLRRSVALVGTTAFGAYLATQYTLGGQLRLLAWALGIAAILSFVFGLALPSYGISSDPLFQGDWQGIYNHKNALGSAMSLAAVVFLILATSSRRHRWIAWGGFVLALSLVVLSNSKTALVVFLAFLILWPIYRSLRWRYTLVVPFLIFAALLGGSIAVGLWSNAGFLLDSIGRDTTLTGRTELWSLVLDKVRERPLLGYGYSGFWLGLRGESASIWLATGSEVPAADNGWLDLWLSLGILGVLVFVAGLSAAFLRAASWARVSSTREGVWPCMFLTFILLYSISESVFLEQNSMFWILYVSTVLSTFNRRATHGDQDPQTTRPGPALRNRTHKQPLHTAAPRRTPGPAENSRARG